MFIDLTKEPPISFDEASKFLAESCRPSYSTWWRWWKRGIKGKRLETVCIGGRRYTTAEAVQRWVAAVTAAAAGEPTPAAGEPSPANCEPASTRSSLERDRAVAQAQRELAEDGI